MTESDNNIHAVMILLVLHINHECYNRRDSGHLI